MLPVWPPPPPPPQTMIMHYHTKFGCNAFEHQSVLSGKTTQRDKMVSTVHHPPHPPASKTSRRWMVSTALTSLPYNCFVHTTKLFFMTAATEADDTLVLHFIITGSLHCGTPALRSKRKEATVINVSFNKHAEAEAWHDHCVLWLATMDRDTCATVAPLKYCKCKLLLLTVFCKSSNLQHRVVRPSHQ